MSIDVQHPYQRSDLHNTPDSLYFNSSLRAYQDTTLQEVTMVDTDSIGWKAFRDNASIKNLVKEGIQVDLIKLEPNSQFDEHVHESAEWIYVLKGSFSDEKGTYSKGHFVVNEKGSKHATKSGAEGCEVIVIKRS
jgi:quercetin dioxygenase-like cupin family protein